MKKPPLIAIIAGTRPEAIKLAPLVSQIRCTPEFSCIVCDTRQHDPLCRETLAYFDIEADHYLESIMQPGQSLMELQIKLLSALNNWLTEYKPDAVVVQGDTMSAYCAAQAAFFHHIPVFHVEAGLRSHNLSEPYPEEMLRQNISRIATLHFAPTQLAKDNLLAEGIAEEQIYVTGNTVIDAMNNISKASLWNAASKIEKTIKLGKPYVLVTVHRRENHGKRLRNIMEAVRYLSARNKDLQFLWPVHPNPAVHDLVYEQLSGLENVRLCVPLSYPELVFAMRGASMIMTDSGGIQEEAAGLGVPLLVLREKTERPEGVALGLAKLVGSYTERIIDAAEAGLEKSKNKTSANPYGDGMASSRILDGIKKYFLDVGSDQDG